MKKIGLIIPSYIAKVKKTFDFADEILSVENVGCDKSMYGQKAEYDRLKVIYKFNDKMYNANISAQIGGRRLEF